jgi:hypothetical protein
MRKIELTYFEEDFNDRAFKNPLPAPGRSEEPRTHSLCKKCRLPKLGQAGIPEGPNSFKSFPDWSNVVGGAMVAGGLGDPCLPFKGEYDDVGGSGHPGHDRAVPGLPYRLRRQMGPEEA